MNLDFDEAVRISAGSVPYRVSGRCSVFCKSDCTHALNKGIPKDEVAGGLALMIAEKAEELLKRAHKGKFILVGGVTSNTTVVDFLKEKFDDIYIPEQAPYFEALGAAVYGLFHDVSVYQNQMFLLNPAAFSLLISLSVNSMKWLPSARQIHLRHSRMMNAHWVWT
jgi:activator of 2-hydroxyglutaryl-CoA dehydratase